MEHVDINIDHLTNIAHTGVRRAAVFMGLGLNAAHNKDFQDYELYKLPLSSGSQFIPVDFVQSNAPPEIIERYKKDFSVWITGCGFREMLECYALFLDHIHQYALLVFQVKNKLGTIDPVKTHKNFRWKGVAEKLKALEKTFDIKDQHTCRVSNFCTARNCLTHDMGVVLDTRLNDGDQFIIEWIAPQILIEGALSGKRRPFHEVVGIRLEEESNVLFGHENYKASFREGERLVLSHEQLWGICYFFNACVIPSFRKTFISFLKANDIPVNITSEAVFPPP